MSIIKCPECGKEIQESIAVCPNCGYPLKSEKDKKIFLFITCVCMVCVLFLVLIITHVICINHDWQDVTCTEPKRCKYCKKTEGEALGHSWKATTCTEPKTCNRCEKTEGEALGHSWQEATCTEPKKCSICKEMEGIALGHTGGEECILVDATINQPGIKAKICSRCGKEYDKSNLTINPGVDGKHFNFTLSEFKEFINNKFSNKYSIKGPMEKDNVYLYGLFQDDEYKNNVISVMTDDDGYVILISPIGDMGLAITSMIAFSFDSSLNEEDILAKFLRGEIITNNNITYAVVPDNEKQMGVIKPDNVYIE